MGLGLNSMEGREAKHICIARYSRNTVYKARWEQIFRHEFISVLWLRERGYNTTKLASSSLSYIPKRAIGNPDYCFCGLKKQTVDLKCEFCLHPLRENILAKIKKIS